jgi:catechol 2,3-dioxygenase-like lactoylglutathione lyase family enzyme
MPRPISILETVLYVDALDPALDFYRRVLKLEPVHGDARMKVLRVNAQNMLLLFKTGATREPIVLSGGTIPPHDGAGGMHVAFSIAPDQLGAFVDHLDDCGVPVEARVDWPSGDTSLYFRDPSRNLVELATPKLWATQDRGE